MTIYHYANVLDAFTYDGTDFLVFVNLHVMPCAFNLYIRQFWFAEISRSFHMCTDKSINDSAI